ncbi:MAG TPA: metallophosphoesterase [Pirellulales bacterium]|nr:metallophosphoesterase [Pirellulales bacterium]
MATPIYLVAMTVALLTACWTLGRAAAEPTISPRHVRLAILAILALACLFAVGLGENGFGVLRLACYGLFGHAAIVAAYGAWLLRRKSRGWAWALAAACVALEAVAVDAFWIEPRWLEVTHQTLASPKLSRPIRLAIVADLQTDQIGDYERGALARVMAEQPDLILFAGDYVQEYNPRRRAELRSQLRSLFEHLKLRAPLGAIAVGGNADLPDWEEIFVDTPIASVAETRSFDLGPLVVTALSIRDSFRTTTRVRAREKFQIVVGHAPNFALGPVEGDLLVAGHTHGGQVRAPWLGPLMTLSLVPRSWASGTTALEGGRTLIVSRGIGMERGFAPRLRFLCRPQLVIVDLLPLPSEDGRGEGEPLQEP